MIEAVTEDLVLKKRIFSEIDAICPEHAILATNTSVLPVIEMARATSRPKRFWEPIFSPRRPSFCSLSWCVPS